MSESPKPIRERVEQEELLEGQPIFKGPRKLRKLLGNGER